MWKLCGSLLTGFLTILAFLPVSIAGQRSGTISGKVTEGGKPVKGVPIDARSAEQIFPPKPSAANSITDDEGNYRLTGLPPGRYKISPYEPTNVLPGKTPWDQGGKDITLGDDEKVDGVDFDVARGGVITGRITNSSGKPLIDRTVTIESADGKSAWGRYGGDQMYQTDDRGVYRVYGLPQGQYVVSVGEDKNFTVANGKRAFYARTFYPGVTERSQGKIIDLGEADEEKNIDIALGPGEKTYSVSGRTIDEATGAAVPNVQLGYALRSAEGRPTGSSGYTSAMRSDAAGEFRVEGLKPGLYSIFAGTSFDGSDENHTSNAVPVEIANDDVGNVTIKTRPGLSVDGVVVLEGNADPKIASKIGQLTLWAWLTPKDPASAPVFPGAKLLPDHSFHISGLSPGTVRVGLSNGPASSGFSILRVEQNGASRPENSIDLLEDASVGNVRIILEYATGVIRGQIVMAGGGSLPPGIRIFVNVVSIVQSTRSKSGEADSRGHFEIQGVAPGEYRVIANAFAIPPIAGLNLSGRQNVTVASGGEENVTITVTRNDQQRGVDQP